MTWAAHAALTERTPCIVVEVDLDYYDDGPDAVAATNDDASLCYRTPHTTDQDGQAFTLTTKTRRWMTKTTRPIPELGAIPCLSSAKIAAEEAKIGKGLAFFGQVTIELQDFTDDDRREDPFYSDASRASIDHSAGTYFSKLMARNPYWTGRKIRVIEGWATDNVWHAADAITHTYFIRDVQGPSGGRFKITAAGPLQLVNLGNREVPAPSEGKLAAAISSGAASFALSDAVVAEDYPSASFYLRIADEVMLCTSRSGVTFNVDRAKYNTIADAHAEGDGVQLCAVYEDQNVTDIIADLLTTYGGVASEYLALSEWADEQAVFLSLYVLSGIVSKPTQVMDVVQSILESSAAIMWWDDDRGQVRLRAVRPSATVMGTWGDRFHLLSPPEVKRDMTGRVSRCDVAIDLRSADLDPKELASYRYRLVGTSLGESATEHGSEQVQVIATQWLSVDQIALASRASAQITAQLRDGRQTIVVEVAAKDARRVIGDTIDVKSRDIVDRTGQPDVTRCIVIKREAIVPGARYRYTLEIVPFNGRYAYFTANDCPIYSLASTTERDPGGFFSDGDGGGLGGDPPYAFG
jgi:predicted thioesterase